MSAKIQHRENGIKYLITLKTGDCKRAGTDADVKIQLIGLTGETEPAILDFSFQDDFERNQVHTFALDLENVGELLCCKLHIEDRGFAPDWFVDFIKVRVEDQLVHFPCYAWVEDGYTTPNATTSLPQNETNEFLQEFRSKYLAREKSANPWADQDKIFLQMTGHLAAEKGEDLPRNLQLSIERTEQTSELKVTGRANLIFNKIANITGIVKFKSLDDMEKLLIMPSIKNRKVSEHVRNNWQEDSEFARQQINGLNPFGLKRLTGPIPSNYNITDEDIKDLLPPGKTIRSEIEAGRLFVSDNSVIEGLFCGLHPVTKAQKYTCSPLLLLRCNEDGYLMPLAIQLFSNRAEGNPVWTPNDAPNDWLLAKMFCNNATSQVQQLQLHLFRTHFMSEPFAVALFRCFARNHPVYRLLHPHLNCTIGVNTNARIHLAAPGGHIDMMCSLGGGGHVEIMQRAFEKITLEDLNVPKRLKAQGLDDPEMIKEFGYREDGLKYWEAIRLYVRGIIDIYYKSDGDIQADKEMQDWIKELETFGFVLSTSVIAPSIATLEELETLLTSIIFVSSVQHCADSYGGFDLYGNPASQPMTMYQPAPTKKGSVTMEQIMATIPDRDMMCLQIAVVHLASVPSEDQVYIGEFPMKFFSEPEPWLTMVNHWLYKKNL